MCPHTTLECALLEIRLCRPCNSNGPRKNRIATVEGRGKNSVIEDKVSEDVD